MNHVQSLLDKEDITYLTKQENILKTLQAPLMAMVNEMSDIDLSPFEPQGKYEHKYHFFVQAERNKQHLYEEGIKAVKSIAKEFVSMIEWYLEDKYDISLDLSLEPTLDFLSLSLETIYELLEKELNGMTFEEKSLETVKQGVRQLLPTSIGKTVEIKQGFYLDVFNNLSLSSKETLAIVLKGMVLFETGQKEITQRMKSILEYGWKEGELDLEKILRFKTYKNGKMTITFINKEEAENFVKYYTHKQEKVV